MTNGRSSRESYEVRHQKGLAELLDTEIEALGLLFVDHLEPQLEALRLMLEEHLEPLTVGTDLADLEILGVSGRTFQRMADAERDAQGDEHG